MGSAIKNIKFDPKKQKLVDCDGCGKSIVVGKYSPKKQRCDNCINLKNTIGKKSKVENSTNDNNKSSSFAERLQELCNTLGFEITPKRSWKKSYPIDGGGISTIYIMPEQGIAGAEPRIEYFSVIVQRAVGINEDFRKYMPIDAASDCEVLAGELGGISEPVSKVGKEQCDECKSYTDEFAVNEKRGKILCIKPNNCFRKSFTSGGAESE